MPSPFTVPVYILTFSVICLALVLPWAKIGSEDSGGMSGFSKPLSNVPFWGDFNTLSDMRCCRDLRSERSPQHPLLDAYRVLFRYDEYCLARAICISGSWSEHWVDGDAGGKFLFTSQSSEGHRS
ncbi:hypothetical protein PM082_022912 [Marasmius tenuissimus]|nr:hypothetical protein PM082_022912 [Marasmius tenuissimus]